MGLWTICGGNPLYGTVTVQGSTNGVLPVLAASLVHNGIAVLERVPRVGDVERTLEILRCLNCKVRQAGDTVTIDSTNAAPGKIPAHLTAEMRSSVLFLGAMAARFGEGTVGMPGGCMLGPRPIDLHLAALNALGADVTFGEADITVSSRSMAGGTMVFPFPSVGATEQAMLAACGCTGETLLLGCAREPEIRELAEYLGTMGAEIIGAGGHAIRIIPGSCRGAVHHCIGPDRIAASTVLCAVAACGGKVTLQEVNCPEVQPILDVLAEMGSNIKIGEHTITLASDGRLWAPVREIVTGPWPEFPTDAQPALMAAALRADGVTVFRERVLPGRLLHGRQLRRFGGNIALTEDCAAVVTGVNALCGAAAEVRDLQGGSALLIAALQADGTSTIVDRGMLARSYAYPDALLRLLGAQIDYTD